MRISTRWTYRGAPRYAISLFLSLISVIGAFAQDAINGTVKDEQGQGLPGVSVVVKGTTGGTVTDLKGDYSVKSSKTGTLVFSFIGYLTQEIPVGNKSSVNVVLVSDIKALSEVIVVGYGTAKKATLTGAVVAVKGAELAKSPVQNLSNSMVGRLPGISAVQSSGEPGYDGSNIKIRGINSLGNSNALIVIDGIPDRSGGLDRINPSDVESVSVLKDAAAAIYGSRAGNGVILITTKRGKSGKPQISYDINMGMAQPTRLPKVMNAFEYSTVRNESAIFDNLPAANWSAANDAFKNSSTYNYTLANGNSAQLAPLYTQDDLQKFQNGSDPLLHPNTDWFGTTIKRWSPQQRHQLQLTGGGENTQYLASLGYQNQDGIYVNSATGYKQYDLRLNLDTRINKYVKANLGILVREESRNFPGSGSSADAIFRMLMRGKPNEIAVWPNGLPGPDIENGQNPALITTNQTGYFKDTRDYVQTNGGLDIDIPGVPGLQIKTTAAIDKQYTRTKGWDKPWYLYYWDKKSYEADGVTPVLVGNLRSTFSDARTSEANAEAINIQLMGQLAYTKSIGLHNFNLMAGIQRETGHSTGYNVFRRYFLTSISDNLAAGGNSAQQIGVNDQSQKARLSYYGRVGYNYKEKYLAEFLWRRDASYVFPAATRWGFFPGVSVGWRVSEEDFWKNNVTFVRNLKVRGSWGQMGAEPYYLNSSNLAEYQFLSTASYNSYLTNDAVVQTLQESRVANQNITWEVANNSNFGIEGTLLNDKLSFTFDYFVNNRSKTLIPKVGSVPSSVGVDGNLPPENLGKLQNKGWEFTLNYDNNIGDFTYSAGLNGGYASNIIKYWNESPGSAPYQRTTGKPFNAFYAYTYDGVFKDQAEIDANKLNYTMESKLLPGDMKFKDIGGPEVNPLPGGKAFGPDGKIDGWDAQRMGKTNRPSLTYGATINLGYKSFDLSILFQGAMGGLQVIGLTESGDIGNYLKYSYDHRWTIDNPSSVDPRLTNRSNRYYTSSYANNTYWIKKNDYLRLKNVELGYNLAEEISKKVGLSKVRIYVNGLNLLTFDKIKVWDPESTNSDGKNYPQSRILNAGVRIAF